MTLPIAGASGWGFETYEIGFRARAVAEGAVFRVLFAPGELGPGSGLSATAPLASLSYQVYVPRGHSTAGVVLPGNVRFASPRDAAWYSVRVSRADAASPTEAWVDGVPTAGADVSRVECFVETWQRASPPWLCLSDFAVSLVPRRPAPAPAPADPGPGPDLPRPTFRFGLV